MTEEHQSSLLSLEPGRITTLVGPPGLELAALTCALAVSYHTGESVLPGWEPDGMGNVIIASYSGDWAEWRGLVSEVCDVAGVADPSIHIQCHDVPLGQKPVERDPDAEPFWARAIEADVEAEDAAAREIGRQLAPGLGIVFGFGMSPASGFGADLRDLYDRLHGPALVVDSESAFTNPTWGHWTWAGKYGPVIRLADLTDTVSGLSAFLECIGSRYVPDVAAESEPEPPAAANGHRGGRDVSAFLAECGPDAIRQLVTDGRSVASHELKSKARSRGIGPWTLHHAARRLSRDVRWPRRVAGVGPGTLYGYAARFNEWRTVDSLLEGRYLERIAPGACARTIATERDRMKVVFRHGKAERIGYQSLGSITLLEEDDHGLRYEVQLVDAEHTWELAPWLATGRYGASLTFEVLRDTFVRKPGPSAHNPRGIPERTLTEIRVQEFGPVSPPAYVGTSAGIRFAAIHS